MSVRFIKGVSGSGKTRWLCNYAIEESKKYPDKQFFYIVPEQFSLKLSQTILDMHEAHAIMNIDILSFNRLAYRVFDELGIKTGALLDDSGKSMLIMKILEDHAQEFRLFNANISRDGFAESLKSAVSEISQYMADTDEMTKALEGHPYTQEKYRELGLLYDHYRDFIKDRFMQPEDILDRLSGEAEKSELLKDCVIILDEFTGFTPHQYAVLEKLIKIASNVLIAVNIDPFNMNDKLFVMGREMMDNISKICADQHVEPDMKNSVELKDTVRFKSPALKHLEADIFRYPYTVFGEKTEDIRTGYARDLKAEAGYAASMILHEVRENGLRFRDIAVLTGDPTQYFPELERQFGSRGIPYFLDSGRSLSGNLFVEMLCMVLDLAQYDYRFEDVIGYIKCGMSEVSAEDADILESYVKVLNLRSMKKWSKSFTRVLKGKYETDLEKLEAIRLKVMEETAPYVKLLKEAKTAAEITKILYDMTVKRDCCRKLKELSEEFGRDKDFSRAKEYEQIYRIFLELFDRIYTFLGDCETGLNEYKRMILSGAGNVRIGIIPLSQDSLIVGDLERTRLSGVKMIFLMGANEGVIPKKIEHGGIISESERRIMLEKGIKLAKDSSSAAFEQQFYIYLALTKAAEKICITYSRVNAAGKAQAPSFLIERLQRMFPGCRHEEAAAVFDETQAKEIFISGLEDKNRMGNGQWRQIAAFALNESSQKEKYEKILVQAARKKDVNIPPETARRIFDLERLSVSKIEQYFKCSYAYFMKYGLKLTPELTYDLSAADLGTIYHEVLEKIFRVIKDASKNGKEPDEKEIEAYIESFVDAAIEKYFTEEMYESAGNRFLVFKIKKLMEQTVETVLRNSKAEGFIPSEFELEFRIRRKGRADIEGKIDRIDYKDEDDKRTYRITDYKSSKKDFDPTLFANGIDLQLVVYSIAADDILKKKLYSRKIALPSGIYYYKLDRPFIEFEEAFSDNGTLTKENERFMEMLDKELKPSGLDIEGGKKPVGMNGLKVLRKKALEKFDECEEGIRNGNIRIDPYQYDKKNACEYCDYINICGFNSEKEHFRRLKRVKLEDILTQDSASDDGDENISIEPAKTVLSTDKGFYREEE